MNNSRFLRVLANLIFLTLFSYTTVFAQIPQTARQRSVQVSATVQQSPPQINFSWPADNSATEYEVFRKNINAPTWGNAIATLPGNATSFSDANVSINQGYEYGFFKHGFDNVTTTACVPSGANLQFDINDMYGIGLCCSFGHGFYEVRGCGQTYAFGDDFGWTATHNFTACSNTTCTDIVIDIAPDLFPNSTWWTLRDADTGVEYANSGGQGAHIAPRPAYGFIFAGIKVPAIESRGTILLVVESSVDAALPAEIAQLREDHIMDGWKFKKLVVNSTDQVTSVKNSIQNIYNATADLNAVMLLGNVPVPYSGDIYPDTHSEFRGSWSADTYYAEMNGTWTDNTVSRSTAFFPTGHNVPGDGKFDQSSIPTPVELQLGRVDLSNLPLFPQDEITLLRNYLNKSSQFKNGNTPVIRRGLVDDNFMAQFAAPAASGYRNFAPMFGANNIDEVDYQSTLAGNNYLWAYGCGSGSHESVAGVTTTAQLANSNNQNVFNMFFGSQFGDWNHPNNILRAPLAQGLTLTNAWAGNPAWQFHQMAMGYNIGYSALRTMNSNGEVYLGGPQLVHVALMGDPTLRLHPVKTVSNISVVNSGITSVISWTPPQGESVLGYNIYRANTLNANYTRLNVLPITTTSFVDAMPLGGNNVYMIRTVKLEESGSGTYCNMALGVVDSIFYDDIALSVDLIEFDINQLECSNQISWKTSANNEIDFFEIERSKDGINFQATKIVATSSFNQYQIEDENTIDFAYYRLKTFYRDGGFQYSNILSIENECQQDKFFVNAFPNPAMEDELTIQFASSSAQVQISMMDANGKVIFNKQIDTQAGTNNLTIDISDLVNGIYFIQLHGTQINEHLKFIRTTP